MNRLAGGDGAEVARIFEERRAALARPLLEGGETATTLLLVVAVGDQRVALPATRTREIAPPGPVARIPARGPLVGVRSVRGEIVAVADLAALLDIDGAAPVPRRWLAVLDAPRDELGVLVDGAVDLVDVSTGALSEQTDGHVLVSHMTDGGVPVIDVDALLTDPRLVIHHPSPATPYEPEHHASVFRTEGAP